MKTEFNRWGHLWALNADFLLHCTHRYSIWLWLYLNRLFLNCLQRGIDSIIETTDTKHYELRHSIIQSFISRGWPLWLAFSCILAVFSSSICFKNVPDSLLFSVCYFSLFHCPQEAFAHWCVPWHLIFLMNRIDLKTFPSSFWKV